MKKILAMIVVAMIATVNVTAQSDEKELAKMQRELNEINMKILNSSPSKDAKKQAKKMRKQGWDVMAGAKSLEKQITESQLLGEVLMADEAGNPVKRYIQHRASAVAGTYNVAVAQARTAASNEISSLLSTNIANAAVAENDNIQSENKNAVTNDKFNQRMKAVTSAALTNMRTVVTTYRELRNGNCEVQLTVAFDKKELSARLKRLLKKELEMEGDKLNDLVDKTMEQAIGF